MERVLPTASTQTYSAKMTPAGKGKSLYRAMTAGSSWDCPVTLDKDAMERAVARAVVGAEGAKAEAVAAKKAVAKENFMVSGVGCVRSRRSEG